MGQELVKTDEAKEERVKTILGKMGEKFPEETGEVNEYLTALRNKNVAILGEDEVFKLTDRSGEIRAFRSTLRLSAADGTLVQPVAHGPFVVSAQGYTKWEEEAGAMSMFAPHVIVDGEEKENPYLRRENGRVVQAYCRAIAFRFTSKGIPQVSDRTIIYDVPAYRLLDLLAKAKQFPQAFRLLPKDSKPKDDGTWASYIFDENTVLWVNTSHEEALRFYSQIINREKKVLEFCQTFAKRNALKHLSGIQRVPGQETPDGKVKPIPVWNLPVICWRPVSGTIIKWDTSRYATVQKQLVQVSAGKTDAIMLMERNEGTELVSEDEEAVADVDKNEEVEQAEEQKMAETSTTEVEEGDFGALAEQEAKEEEVVAEQVSSEKSKEEPKKEQKKEAPTPPPPPPPEPKREKKKEPPKETPGIEAEEPPPPQEAPPLKLPPREATKKEAQGTVFSQELEDIRKKYPEALAQAQKETGIFVPKTPGGAKMLVIKTREILGRTSK